MAKAIFSNIEPHLISHRKARIIPRNMPVKLAANIPVAEDITMAWSSHKKGFRKWIQRVAEARARLVNWRRRKVRGIRPRLRKSWPEGRLRIRSGAVGRAKMFHEPECKSPGRVCAPRYVIAPPICDCRMP